MKAQFATIEALSSLLIAISAISLSVHMINNSQQTLFLERSNISSKAAAYDFLMQISYNKSMQQCLSSASNSTCINNYSIYYQAIYGVKGLGIVQDQKGSDNYPNIYCESESNGSIVCVGVS